MSANPTPEDTTAEAETVLGLQQATAAESDDEVQAHMSALSVALCSSTETDS
jgi:hypothetical protein